MCGGFIMAYSSVKVTPLTSSLDQFFAHLIYNLGRVSSYVLLGVIFGFFGSIFTFSAKSSGYFYFVIGIVMVLLIVITTNRRDKIARHALSALV